MLIAIPIMIAAMFTIGYLLGYLSGNGLANGAEGDTPPAITEDAEVDRGVQYDTAILFSTLSVLLPAMTTGYVTNFMFKTDGWKYVRTIKKADKKYVKALWINVGLSLLTVALTVVLFNLVLSFITGDPISVPALICTMIPAFLGNIFCCVAIFIKEQIARVIVMIVTMIAAEFEGMFTVRTVINGVMEPIIGIVITAVTAVVLLGVIAVASKKISKRWLLD